LLAWLTDDLLSGQVTYIYRRAVGAKLSACLEVHRPRTALRLYHRHGTRLYDWLRVELAACCEG
jgi:hypothetical protein